MKKKVLVFVLGTGVKELNCRNPKTDKKGRKKQPVFPLSINQDENEARLRRKGEKRKHSGKCGVSYKKSWDDDEENFKKRLAWKELNSQGTFHLNTRNGFAAEREVIKPLGGKIEGSEDLILNFHPSGKLEAAHYYTEEIFGLED